MASGSQAALAIRYLLEQEVLSQQREYEARLNEMILVLGSRFGLRDPRGISLALKQIRTLPLEERQRASLKILKMQFPQLMEISEEELMKLLEDLQMLERKAGRLHLNSARIRKSTILSIMRPIDERWVDSHPFVMQRMDEADFQKETADLKHFEIQNTEGLAVWQSKVFDLFLKVIVFDPYLNPELRELSGLVRVDQVRSYRRNWLAWFSLNAEKLMAFMLSKELETSLETLLESKKSAEIELRKSLRVLKERFDGFSQLPGTYKKSKSATEVKLGIRPQGYEELTATRIWNDVEDLRKSLKSWLESIEQIWGIDSPKLMISLAIQTSDTKANLVYTASSPEDAFAKTLKVLEVDS